MSGGVPAGWVLVPVEPTSDMCVAGWKYADTRDAVLGNGEIAALYAAMLAATPTPPIEGRDAGVERVEVVARALCVARGWNPDTCLWGSAGATTDGAAEFTCQIYMWQNCIPEARAALQALGERG
ncbi:hypothetical protein [Sphingomonas sp.]|uniref:hypothetical protein n=1 Tax=Sphingomonas sp. TaxID=28214 RepID=UPI000DBBEC43|nr:hypothetical protein [Sphingomonas sp.]PZT91982.1 MAG: hypothetical protein DI625_14710 [Sphingomonas sp.]